MAKLAILKGPFGIVTCCVVYEHVHDSTIINMMHNVVWTLLVPLFIAAAAGDQMYARPLTTPRPHPLEHAAGRVHG